MYCLWLLFVRWKTTRSYWNWVPYIWFYDLHPAMIYILWPEDGLKQRPKHVVSLNKTTKTSCVVTYVIPTSFRTCQDYIYIYIFIFIMSCLMFHMFNVFILPVAFWGFICWRNYWLYCVTFKYFLAVLTTECSLWTA